MDDQDDYDEAETKAARKGEGRGLRILMVRPSALGDVARTVPVLVSLRKKWPGARIDWVVNSAFVEVVGAHPDVDEVISFDRKGLSKFGRSRRATKAGWMFAKKLREAKYDLVIDLQGLARSGMITWLTRSKKRVGFKNAREMAWLGYNVRHNVEEGVKHTVDQMLRLIEGEGIEVVKDMRLYTSQKDKRWFKEFQKENGIGEGGYACIAPTARWMCKCWPIEKYGEVAKRLLESGIGGEKLVVIAAPNERGQLDPMLEYLENAGIDSSRIILPNTSVGQMMTLIEGGRVMVCNDSAPLHIAIGFGKPVATMFGPTDPEFVGPFERMDTVVQPEEAKAEGFVFNYREHKDDQSLIGKIEVEEVWERLKSN